MKRIIAATIVALFALGFTASIASAKTTTKAPAVKVFNLKGSDVLGELVRPDGTWIQAAPAPELKSLIDYRLDFNAEMVKSSQNI